MASVPALVLRHNVAPDESAWFRSWGSLLAERKRLPRSARPAFDSVHASLARLSLLHERHGATDPHAEQALVEQLAEARSRLRQVIPPRRG
jgi:hypothetical protein